MGTRSLLERIADAKDFTDGERKLAWYFEREHKTLHLETIESLSKKAGVSKSSLSRFVTRLGYQNFRTFLRSVWQEGGSDIETPIVRYGKRDKTRATADALLHDHLAAVCINMQRTLEIIRPEAFARALDLLSDESRHLYLLGSSASGHLLGYYSVLMYYLRRNVTLLTGDIAAMAREVALPPKNSVVFAMTYKRYASATNTLLEFFHERGHESILLTDSYSAPGIPHASVPLVVDSGGANMFNTRCSALAVLEALISGVSARLESSVPERYEAFGELLRRLNIYSN